MGFQRTFFTCLMPPWWGGFYERLVRWVKTPLKKILKKALLTFEELQTVLTEIEATINQRPLCYTSDEDIGDTITPNHLMFGRQPNQRNSTYPEVSSMSTKDCNRRIDYINIVLKHFWKRFGDTYLNELKQRHLYNHAKSADATLKINDVVLVRDDIPKSRTQWMIGKVEELIIGRDGKL